jgi:hypothetical protein
MKPGAFEQRNKQSIRQLSNAKHTISEQRFIEFHRFIGVLIKKNMLEPSLTSPSITPKMDLLQS